MCIYRQRKYLRLVWFVEWDNFFEQIILIRFFFLPYNFFLFPEMTRSLLCPNWEYFHANLYFYRCILKTFTCKWYFIIITSLLTWISKVPRTGWKQQLDFAIPSTKIWFLFFLNKQQHRLLAFRQQEEDDVFFRLVFFSIRFSKSNSSC